MPEAQRLERLAERLRSLDPVAPSPAAKIRGWNLVAAEVQRYGSRRAPARSMGRLVLAGLAAASLLAAGAVAASADSLPDSALYPVKGAIENVQGVFTFTPSDQFNHHLSLARTRLREAEAMIARHRIDLAGKALAGLNEQLQGAAAVVRTLADTSPSLGNSLEQQLRQAIETHDAQLASLQGEVTNPTAIAAITQARDKAQRALQVAADASRPGQGKEPGPSSQPSKGHAGGTGKPSNSGQPAPTP